MAGIDLAVFAAILVASGTLAFGILWGLSRLDQRQRQPSLFGAGRAEVVFLFEDERLVDATPGARQLLSVSPHEGSPWSRLMHVLLPRFPGLPDELSRLVDAGTLSVESSDGRSRIDAEWRQGLARVTLVDVERHGSEVLIDKLALAAMEEELATLRNVADEVPYLTWKEAPDGTVVWANAAYLDASERLMPPRPIPAWPPYPVFQPGAAAAGDRLSVRFPGDRQETWYELRQSQVPGGVLKAALPVDAIVRAERSRADFVQTLSKTFANLTIGLAIFDRSRKLALFNPALTDLTGLPAEFLSRRPALETFLDRLREARVLPEPKNFSTWRQKLTALEHEAVQGTYAETWTLPDGQVFEVTGRPHPDGAIALLIEDVSAEMRLTRRFRSELALNQAVFDSLPEALAVFGDDGLLRVANAAYCRMWGLDPQALATVTLAAAVRGWRDACLGGGDWSRLIDPGRPGSARAMAFTADRRGDTALDCRFQPLPGGALLAGFREAGNTATTIPTGPARAEVALA